MLPSQLLARHGQTNSLHRRWTSSAMELCCSTGNTIMHDSNLLPQGQELCYLVLSWQDLGRLIPTNYYDRVLLYKFNIYMFKAKATLSRSIQTMR